MRWQMAASVVAGVALVLMGAFEADGYTVALGSGFVVVGAVGLRYFDAFFGSR